MPLHFSGWTSDALRNLFRSQEIPSSCIRLCFCQSRRQEESNERQSFRPLKQPKWLRFLWKIKHHDGTVVLSEKSDTGLVGKNLRDDGKPNKRLYSGPQEHKSTDEPASSFCYPDRRGCYVCQDCWQESRDHPFWDPRDINPNAWPVTEQLDDDDEVSPFLLSLT